MTASSTAARPRWLLPGVVAVTVAAGALVGLAVSELFNDGNAPADMIGGVLAIAGSTAGGAWGGRIRKRRAAAAQAVETNRESPDG